MSTLAHTRQSENIRSAKAFYDRGWRGINIEPVASLFAGFVADRPDDLNLQVAVAAHESQRTIFSIPAFPACLPW